MRSYVRTYVGLGRSPQTAGDVDDDDDPDRGFSDLRKTPATTISNSRTDCWLNDWTTGWLACVRTDGWTNERTDG